jgi:hypothetical protein
VVQFYLTESVCRSRDLGLGAFNILCAGRVTLAELSQAWTWWTVPSFGAGLPILNTRRRPNKQERDCERRKMGRGNERGREILGYILLSTFPVHVRGSPFRQRWPRARNGPLEGDWLSGRRWVRVRVARVFISPDHLQKANAMLLPSSIEFWPHLLPHSSVSL